MRLLRLLFVFLVQVVYYTKGIIVQESPESPPTCDSNIYCQGNFLHDVQTLNIYSDSKTFVDMKLKFNESVILAKYNKLKKTYENSKNTALYQQKLIEFINQNLEDGNELEEWMPNDFVENPSIINKIKDKEYKVWAFELNAVWKTLSRKVKDDVKINAHLYSLIHVPNGFIIPGGRFKELYYWDTYWIVNGLLLCDMKTTARGIIDNIVSIVRTFGFMFNGARVYYRQRTQPPMLILMALNYYSDTNDFDYIRSIMPVLETEFKFWMNNRMVDVEKGRKTYRMARYYAPSSGPRPESYREDYEIAEHFDEVKKREFYTNIKSGAETGWDFSSRWFITRNGSHKGRLSDIQTSNIVPVDLNCILHVNALTLSTWTAQMGDETKSYYYKNIANQFLNGIEEVLWNEGQGVWFDWDLINKKHRDYFYISNIVPLWTGSYNMPKKAVASAVLGYLKEQHIIEPDYSISFNGTPTSMYASSQQWDFPNAWPPLQAFIIQGLYKTNYEPAQKVASNLAEVWLRSNYKGFKFNNSSLMHEKYDVTRLGETGGGGEYTPQTGFGWTNGVVLELLNQFNNASHNAAYVN